MIFTSSPSRLSLIPVTLLPVLCAAIFVVSFSTLPAQRLHAADRVAAPGNYGDAMRWYERSAKAGNARAQFYLGMLFEQGHRPNSGGKPDAKSAIAWFTKAAEQGHRQAQLKLGLIYYQSTLVEKDYAEAVRWFEKAAAQSSSQAVYNLALMLVRGLGVKKDAKRAATLFEKIVDRGSHEAALHLAVLYGTAENTKNPDNLKQDKILALMWLEWAVGKGLAPDPAFHEKLTQSMSPAEIKKARELALKRLKK